MKHGKRSGEPGLRLRPPSGKRIEPFTAPAPSGPTTAVVLSDRVPEADVDFDATSGHAHTGSDSTAVDHANLTGVSANQHHAQSHGQADHTGTGSAADVGTVTGAGSGTMPASIDHTHRGVSKKFSQASVAGGDTVANTASETAFTASYTLPANSLAVGDTVRLRMWGVFSQDIVPATLRGKIKLGSTIVLDTGTLSGFATVTNAGWMFQADLTVTAIGGSGAVEAQGYASFASAATAALAAHITNTAPITIDTTAGQAIVVTVQWGTAAAANTITRREMTVEIL
jgi:hypothetical protein